MVRCQSVEYLSVSVEHRKLLASALRTRILHLTADTPMTAKEVADRLGESPGNVHYHMRLLLQGGLLEIVETRKVRGVTQKYYRARATAFRLEDPDGVRSTASRVDGVMALTDAEVEQRLMEVGTLLHRWEKQASIAPREGATNRWVLMRLLGAPPEEELTK